MYRKGLIGDKRVYTFRHRNAKKRIPGYAAPNHRDGVAHRTRADAEADNEHFDGKTTE